MVRLPGRGTGAIGDTPVWSSDQLQTKLRARLRVTVAVRERGGPKLPLADHRNHAGWPILDEHAALSDRIDAINPARPAAHDLADLAYWVTHHAHDRRSASRSGFRAWMETHRSDAPQSSDRLAAILAATNGHDAEQPALCHLADDVNQAARRSRTVGHVRAARR